MRISLSIILILTALNCAGQTWIEYKVDSNLTLRLPDNFVVRDTLRQHILRADIDHAIVMVQRMVHKRDLVRDIDDKDDLILNYQVYVKEMVQAEKAELIDKQPSEWNGAQVIRFSYRIGDVNERQVRHFMLVFLNENWYVMQFWELEEFGDQLKEIRDDFFSSVKFPEGVTLENQLSYPVEQNTSYRIGHFLGYYGLLGLGIWALIAFVVACRGDMPNELTSWWP